MANIQYIRFHGVFDFYSSEAFIEAFKILEASEQPIIPIQIKSPGGLIYALAEILDVVDSCKKPVVTYTTSIAASCGCALAMAGSVRFVGPNARLMIHQASTITWGKASDIESDSNVINSMTQQFIYDRCDKAAGKESGYTKNLVKENFNADLFLTADEALQHGFFDEIGTIENIDVNHILELYKKKKENM